MGAELTVDNIFMLHHWFDRSTFEYQKSEQIKIGDPALA